MSATIIVLDFGSQYTRLIARCVRGLGFYSEVLPGDAGVTTVQKYHPKAFILSGGPESVYSRNAPVFDRRILQLKLPLLGICYGMGLLVQELGGEVAASAVGEYGASKIHLMGAAAKSLLFKGIPKRFKVWMSHGDSTHALPPGCMVTAESREKAVRLIASFENREGDIYGLQFHPEVAQCEYGEKILNNFLTRVVLLKASWSMPAFLESTGQELCRQVRGRSLVAAVSGGVDSTVMAVLLARFIKKNLRLVLIDNGLLRAGEVEEVKGFYRALGLTLEVVDARDKFLQALKGVRRPEEKRRIIGRIFVEVFFKYAKPLDLLAQGTLYPDVIESVSTVGPSHTIKTHHNRVKEILALMKKGQVIEPFKNLFKDEVRELGKVLKIPQAVLGRHPFPGPGLAVRVLGTLTEKRLTMLRMADAILQQELKREQLLEKTWQSFAVLLPIKSVGVAGDKRHYGATVVIRTITSRDGMTADFFLPSKEFLSCVSGRITGEVPGVTRVVLDLSSKPPATIEWE